jgi:hypothetical protein
VHEKSKIKIQVLCELKLFIDKKVIFDEKKISVETPRRAVCRLSANFVIHISFFLFNLDTSPFQVKVF